MSGSRVSISPPTTASAGRRHPGFFADQPRLRAFLATGAGVERVLNNPNLPPDLPLVRVEDAGMGEQMVDYCRFEVLRWMQRRDEYAVQQAAGLWKQLPDSARDEWPVGIFGLGVLGRQVANAFAAEGFPVNAFSRSNTASEPKVRLFTEAKGADQFEAFMRATRVLMILAPLTSATQDKFDRKTLQLLPRGAYVINVARGGLIVDEGLLELLDNEHLNGAALDVFRQEPLPRTASLLDASEGAHDDRTPPRSRRWDLPPSRSRKKSGNWRRIKPSAASSIRSRGY